MYEKYQRSERVWLMADLSATCCASRLGLGGLVEVGFGALEAHGQDPQPLTSPKCLAYPAVIPAMPLSSKDWNDKREANGSKLNFDNANAERKRTLDDEALKLLILAKGLKARRTACRADSCLR